jgi:hypothetical protein
MGHQVGHWTECDRFDRCQQHEYPEAYAREQRRPEFKQEVPISYQNGKYLMDFGSCRSTWVTQATGSDPVILNISGDYPYRCQISYFPQSVLDHGGKGGYDCFVPFEVGRRKLASLDLHKELPLLGLPQFCREENEKGGGVLKAFCGLSAHFSEDVRGASRQSGFAKPVMKYRKLRNGVARR